MSLGGWMNKILIGWGIDPKFADMFDETIIALLMVGLSIGLDYCRIIGLWITAMRNWWIKK